MQDGVHAVQDGVHAVQDGCTTLRTGASHRVFYRGIPEIYPIFYPFFCAELSIPARRGIPTVTGLRTLRRAEVSHPGVLRGLSPGPLLLLSAEQGVRRVHQSMYSGEDGVPRVVR